MPDRNPPAGGAGETKARSPQASLLIAFPDVEGNPVYFDPFLVTGLREVVDKSRNYWTTLVFIGVAGGTTQIFTVLERAELVGNRINMYRRGLGEKTDQAVAELKRQRMAEAFGAVGKLVIPDQIFVHTEGAGAVEGTAD